MGTIGQPFQPIALLILKDVRLAKYMDYSKNSQPRNCMKIVKSWPFKGQVMDLINKIHPPSSKCHIFIIVATDYFTKW